MNTNRLVLLGLFVCILFLGACSEQAPQAVEKTLALPVGSGEVVGASGISQLAQKVASVIEQEARGLALADMTARVRCSTLPTLDGEIYLTFLKRTSNLFMIDAALVVDATVNTARQTIHLRIQEQPYINTEPLAGDSTVAQLGMVVESVTPLIQSEMREQDCMAWITWQENTLWRVVCETSSNNSSFICEYFIEGLTGEVGLPSQP